MGGRAITDVLLEAVMWQLPGQLSHVGIPGNLGNYTGGADGWNQIIGLDECAGFWIGCQKVQIAINNNFVIVRSNLAYGPLHRQSYGGC